VSETETAEIDEIKKLKKLFLTYTKNDKRIVSQKFLKMMKDSKIFDKNFDLKKADILFSRETKYSVMDFHKFCDVLVKISQIKFPQLFETEKNKSLNNVIAFYFLPLYDKIHSINNERNDTPKMNNFLANLGNHSTKKMIEENFLLFKVVYDNYFPWEKLNIAYTQKKRLSEKGFQKFIDDFELCPNLVSKMKGIEIFEEMFLKSSEIQSAFNDLRNLHIGSSFGIFYLVSALFLISVVSYENLNETFEENCII
jgi:hypothetical protein